MGHVPITIGTFNPHTRQVWANAACTWERDALVNILACCGRRSWKISGTVHHRILNKGSCLIRMAIPTPFDAVDIFAHRNQFLTGYKLELTSLELLEILDRLSLFMVEPI